MFEVYLISLFIAFVGYTAKWSENIACMRAASAAHVPDVRLKYAVSKFTVFFTIPLMILTPILNTWTALGFMLGFVAFLKRKVRLYRVANDPNNPLVKDEKFRALQLGLIETSLELADIGMNYAKLGNRPAMAQVRRSICAGAEIAYEKYMKVFREMEQLNEQQDHRFDAMVTAMRANNLNVRAALDKMRSEN